ncbi:redox-sensitive transcriptional activator SoxR [Qipengyuania qiaonensis]|uniref:Redox-sensitive transcriptional activator SoxR n=1 Tax=Qipengyuania qiaonensis TaxID=2867240 RepID=A0ABS7J2P6_9SPHN|nr:redox-sensitive transcriptional activator SoxR [Qipengyuania qiaonensis]MBX7481597.1 redox-sensitive transcriptional activator SoxR [Qipengyuania qiaonensis]
MSEACSEKIDIKRPLTVGEVASRSGCSVSAIHFYEREGLIESWRTSGNQRRFARDVLRRIAIIRVAQQAGVSIAELRAVLRSLPNGRTPTQADWEKLSAGWRDRLDERITALTNLRDGLADCIGCGCLSVRQCPLRNKGDHLGRGRPGAALL